MLKTPQELLEEENNKKKEQMKKIDNIFSVWLENVLIPEITSDGYEGEIPYDLYMEYEYLQTIFLKKGWISTFSTKKQLHQSSYHIQLKPATINIRKNDF